MNQQVRPAAIIDDPYSNAFVDGFSSSLASADLLDPASAQRAKRAATQTGERFDTVLVKLGIVSEADLALHLARYLALPLYVPGDDAPKRILPDVLSRDFMMQNRLLPVRLDSTTLTIAIVDPFDRMPVDSLRFVTDKAIRCELITLADFERATSLLQFAPDLAEPAAREVSAGVEPNEYDLQRLRDSASEAPVIRLVNDIIAKAVDLRASDIHLEPNPNGLSVRYRIDGVLRTMEDISARLRPAILSRIKIMAKLDIAERRLPQDGRIKLAFRGNEIDFRTATIPTMNGESIVMRVLDRNRVKLDFEHLGFTEDQILALRRLMEHANGIVLVTGPTGSGKTTTLYTMLRHLNQATSKIFTVEDPIEYQLTGISQVQVQQQIGLDFPACLRAILRQDPDMIMIGEIRDEETARIAVQSSLTGHLVFSTLHTNSAAETVTRLIDMGIEHFLLGSTIRGILAQRLVRRLCPHCATPHSQMDGWRQILCEQVPSLRLQSPRLMQPGRCDKCQNSGYRGRLSVAELLIVDEAIQRAILTRSPSSEVLRVAQSSGMRTMYQDGIMKAWQGLTTIEDVLRATGIEQS